ncbi:MAG: KOW motif-containing protein [Verrucomicrobia bacterium]|nr:KOW motif-containing protein [Verrucomicrobiota bacterium]
MRPRLLNKVCAYPVAVSWVIGACALDVAIVVLLSKEVTLTAIASDWQAAMFLALSIIPATLLGYFVGMFTCWPFVRPICSRVNGAPFKAGDRVMILSGPQKGHTAEVHEITVGQGGWNLARVELGEERRKEFRDIFEEYSLLKMNGEQDAAPNSRPPSLLPTSPDVQS